MPGFGAMKLPCRFGLLFEMTWIIKIKARHIQCVGLLFFYAGFNLVVLALSITRYPL